MICKLQSIVLLGIIFTMFSSAYTSDKTSYILLEGKEAQDRLDFQNNLLKKSIIHAFNQASSLSNIEGATVVDFGCGTSSAYKDIKILIGSSGKYIGIDSSIKQIEFNKKQFNNVEYIVGDEHSEEVKEVLTSADIIYLRFVVMHQKDQTNFLKNIYDLVKPQALIIIQEPEADSARRKKWIAERYPFATDLGDFKENIGKKSGINYNFANQIEPTLRTFHPTKIIHDTEWVRLPMPEAKIFLQKTLQEINSKNSNILENQELSHYLNIISKLPERAEDEWIVDLMHTIITQKSNTLLINEDY